MNITGLCFFRVHLLQSFLQPVFSFPEIMIHITRILQFQACTPHTVSATFSYCFCFCGHQVLSRWGVCLNFSISTPFTSGLTTSCQCLPSPVMCLWFNVTCDVFVLWFLYSWVICMKDVLGNFIASHIICFPRLHTFVHTVVIYTFIGEFPLTDDYIDQRNIGFYHLALCSRQLGRGFWGCVWFGLYHMISHLLVFCLMWEWL